ncbi:MAG: hypothetical protein WBF49_04715, partial [Methyloceanibacter sp.]
FATAGAAMVHVAQNFFGINENLMAAFAFDMGNKADAARIVLVLGIVESLRRRRQSLPRELAI